MTVVHCFTPDQKKFSNCPCYDGWYFVNVDQWSYVMKPKTWDTHLGNPANAVDGVGGCCKFPKFSPLLPALSSKLYRGNLPKRDFFQLFFIKEISNIRNFSWNSGPWNRMEHLQKIWQDVLGRRQWVWAPPGNAPMYSLFARPRA